MLYRVIVWRFFRARMYIINALFVVIGLNAQLGYKSGYISGYKSGYRAVEMPPNTLILKNYFILWRNRWNENL